MGQVRQALVPILLALALAGCETELDFKDPRGLRIGDTNTGWGRPGGLPPASGRTDAERQARRDYYSGPRGDEF